MIQELTPVGERLRLVRTARRRTLRDVAEAAGVSESFLSQLERGRTNASLATLRRIAVALGVTIGELFEHDGGSAVHVVRSQDRHGLEFGMLGRKFHLNDAPDRAVDLTLCEFEPGGSTGDESYAHGDSEEVAIVLEGTVEFELGGETVALAKDDSIRYRSSVPHRVTASAGGARLLFVTTPPSF